MLIDESVDPLGQHDKIVFDPAVFSGDPLTPPTMISLHPNYGRLEIFDGMTIDGKYVDGIVERSKGVRVDASGIGNPAVPGDGTQVFYMELHEDKPSTAYPGNDRVELRGLTITGGDAGEHGGGLAIMSQNGLDTMTFGSEVILRELVVKDNYTHDSGGGVYIQSEDRHFQYGTSPLQVTIVDSVISHNQAFNGGGGVYASMTPDNLANELGYLESPSLRIVRSRIDFNEQLDDFSGLQGGGGIQVLMSYSQYAFVESQYPNFVLEFSVVADNVAASAGGGLFLSAAHSHAIVSNAMIERNNAEGDGGGVFADLGDNADFTVDRTSVALNGQRTPSLSGGGVRVGIASATGKFTLSNSTVDHNRTILSGGGLHVTSEAGGKLDAVNSTISGNGVSGTVSSTGQGGGIYLAGGVIGSTTTLESTLRHLTITKNKAQDGGGVYSHVGSLTKTTIQQSIISENVNPTESPNNLGGRIEAVDSVYNLIGSGGSAVYPIGMGNHNGNNEPQLDPLNTNGGPTRTHALKSGSPAINAGNPNGSNVPNDQRGEPYARIRGGRIDIGAYESSGVDTLRVVNVTMDGRNEMPGDDSTGDPAYSFANHDGSGVQLYTVPVASVDTIKVTFNAAVTSSTIGAASLTLKGFATTPPALHATEPFVLSADGLTATWKFATPLVWSHYLMTISDSIAGAAGALDGDWVNPSSIFSTTSQSFPSGDGEAGGRFQFLFTIMPGDITNLYNGTTYSTGQNVISNDDLVILLLFFHDPGSWRWENGNVVVDSNPQDVSSVDLNSLLPKFNKSLQYRFQADINGDGKVNGGDHEIIMTHFGMAGTYATGDVNEDGLIDGADLLIWQRNFFG